MSEFWNRARLWSAVGIGVKRWLAVIAMAVILLALGLANGLLLAGRFTAQAILVPAGWPSWPGIVLPVVTGAALLLFALLRLADNVTAPFRRADEAIGSQMMRHRRGRRGPRIVAIGGGTGMPALLRGLREHTSNITAIVTVADDGGSSGRLRREFGMLPPGDFRNNLAALAPDEALITQLLQFRFGSGLDEANSQLRGHALGNLLLAALTEISGSFEKALLAMNRVLALRGQVLPSTLATVTLVADVAKDGKMVRVKGESRIPESGGRIRRVHLEPERVRVYPPVLKAIFGADLIVMGPGSLYTSVLPNLLVPELAEALRLARAPRVYVCNIATQPGETDGYGVYEHVEAIVAHTSSDILTHVLANNNVSLPANPETIWVMPTVPKHAALIEADLVDQARPWRHDSAKLSAALLALATASDRVVV